MSKTRHFLTLLDFSSSELRQIIDRAIELKRARQTGTEQRRFKGKVLGMIFEKSSTRTRVSFEAGMAQLGGHAMFLSGPIPRSEPRSAPACWRAAHPGQDPSSRECPA